LGCCLQNYAGSPAAYSTQLVLNTIYSVFPTCRTFRDSAPTTETDDSEGEEGRFTNIAVFCTYQELLPPSSSPSSSASSGDGESDDGDADSILDESQPEPQQQQQAIPHLITFRKPTEADIRGSLGRKLYIPPQPEWELPYDPFSKARAVRARPKDSQGGADSDEGSGSSLRPSIPVLHRGDEREIEKQNVAAAREHWKIMRVVLPPAVWELW